MTRKRIYFGITGPIGNKNRFLRSNGHLIGRLWSGQKQMYFGVIRPAGYRGVDFEGQTVVSSRECLAPWTKKGAPRGGGATLGGGNMLRGKEEGT